MTPLLDGIRVLDLSNVLAGPFCTYQLALLGAEVVKIEQPGRGDLARRLGADPEAAERGMGASFVAVNGNKQSVTLDLKKPEGKAIFLEMVARAHVVVENFRPGVMRRLGLDHAELARIKPSLVYCAISGFGADGPLSQRPAYDQIIQGAAGVMSITGDAQSAPLRVGYPVSDTMGGMTAAFAVVSALLRALRTGEGAFLDVSMLEATLASMGWVVSNHLNAGIDPQPMGNANFTAAPSGTFRTGQGLLNISANEDKQYTALCALLERPDLLSDPRFATRQARKQNRDALTAEVEAGLASRGAAEWEELLVRAGVPAGRVLSVPEVLAHPHLAGRGFVAELKGEAGPQRVTRGGFRVDGESALPRQPAPGLSADTRRWLVDELGHDEADLARLAKEGVI
ncbi:CoA transferase [Roseomonas marmotae]|uniref:CaiB/BaiF CoA transferase family protein n=1 Tax=Roseomonas marmotae TaxID=2768161 RepID=UPI001AD6BD0B|nr:CoA transferase [Roseomonas marmotae]QTI80042.1 CoA transferase [Roseomonas marmotae]